MFTDFYIMLAGHLDDATCWDRPSICGRSHR